MKKSISVAVLLALLLITTQLMFGWGNLTHVYYAKQLGAKYGFTNMQEMYGALLPDTYNYLFGEQGQYLQKTLHVNWMAICDNAVSHEEKAVAFGFVTHNGLWGADYTAHEKAFTTPGGGYAVVKGLALAPQLAVELAKIFVAAGLPSADAEAIAGMIAPEMGHDVCETAVDILVRRNIDPLLGVRMAAAAKIRPASTGSLLCRAYADGFAGAVGISKAEAAAIIAQGEAAYDEQMVQYGIAFSLPEKQTIALLSQQFASIAADFIQANVGISVTIDPSLVTTYLGKAIAIVEPDYRKEVSKTLAMIEYNLKSHRVTPILALSYEKAEVALESVDEVRPGSFQVAQNYPNPFNPTTTISYALPAEGYVSVKVFNALGEEVADLEKSVQPAGVHSVVWNATGVPSGVYFYRVNANGVVQTRKMTLMK